MQHPLHPGGTFGPVDDGQKPSISRLRKGKGSNGKGKGTSSSDGIKPACDYTGIVKCHIFALFNQLFLSNNTIKYRGYICVSIHNINSCLP